MNRREAIEEIVEQVLQDMVDLEGNGLEFSEALSFDDELEEAGVDGIVEVLSTIFSCEIRCHGRIGDLIDSIETQWNGQLPKSGPEEYFEPTKLNKLLKKWSKSATPPKKKEKTEDPDWRIALGEFKASAPAKLRKFFETGRNGEYDGAKIRGGSRIYFRQQCLRQAFSAGASLLDDEGRLRYYPFAFYRKKPASAAAIDGDSDYTVLTIDADDPACPVIEMRRSDGEVLSETLADSLEEFLSDLIKVGEKDPVEVAESLLEKASQGDASSDVESALSLCQEAQTVFLNGRLGDSSNLYPKLNKLMALPYREQGLARDLYARLGRLLVGKGQIEEGIAHLQVASTLEVDGKRTSSEGARETTYLARVHLEQRQQLKVASALMARAAESGFGNHEDKGFYALVRLLNGDTKELPKIYNELRISLRQEQKTLQQLISELKTWAQRKPRIAPAVDEYCAILSGADPADGEKSAELAKWWEALPQNWKSIFQESLKLNGSPSARDLFDLSQKESLRVKKCGNTLAPLSRLVCLRRLSFFDSTLKSLAGIERVEQLEQLSLYSAECLTSLASVAGLAHLTELEIDEAPIDSYEPLKQLPRLQALHLYHANLEGKSFPSLPALRCLTLTGKVRDISFLSSMTQLEELDLSSTQP